jgi:cytochrome P450
MHDLADLLPVNVVAELMGADLARCPDFRRWTRHILSASSRATMNAEQLAAIRRSVDEARAYFKDLIAQYKRQPAENIVCDFIAAQEGDERLTDDEIMALTILLMIGGDETTGHLMGNMLVLLWQHPEQFELLKAEPRRIPDAIDESLRYWAPVQTAFLSAVKDANIDGVTIPAGSTVVAVWGCANHDERHYVDPARFDITREKRGHLAFGSGPHFCVGNMLARQEATTMMQLLLERMPNIRVESQDSIDWFPSYWNRGPRSLPVLF